MARHDDIDPHNFDEDYIERMQRAWSDLTDNKPGKLFAESAMGGGTGKSIRQAISQTLHETKSKTDLLPHQIPPEPRDWYGWLLLAGRGTGKTEACSRYVVEHVHGPPCMPGPTPHWIGIIAPTLADAATSCFAGPSGIRRHDPTARLSMGAGGLTIKWQNGSEAKLFGANAPEDVERLRAGGNRCISINSLVLTDHGLIPIQNIKTGNLVWTRAGLRPVIKRWDNGVRPIWRLTLTDGRSIEATADHKVLTQRGWIELQTISPQDTVVTCKLNDGGWIEQDKLNWDNIDFDFFVRRRDSALHDDVVPQLEDIYVNECLPTGHDVPVYDLTIANDHEYIVEGIVVHNCLNWLEELAAWRYLDDCWNQMRFGLRTGPRPHWIGSTTPKPKPLIKNLYKGTVERVVLTRGVSMYDNPYLPQDIKVALEDAYGGTSLGAQELYGQIIEQDENALWQREWIETHRLPEKPDGLQRITVGVDPSGGAGEQGIVVVGKCRYDVIEKGVRRQILHGYTLDDRTCHLSPDGWGKRAIKAAVDWEADDLVVETNFGGDMAAAVLRGAADDYGIAIPIRQVRASRGKRARAEPVAALSERGRWHFIGVHEALEDQLCTWTPDLGYSPDRLDAMVWAGWHLKLASVVSRVRSTVPMREMTQRIT